MRTILICLSVLLAAVAPAGGAVVAPNFDATVDLPNDFRVGTNEVRVTVDNTASGDVLFSPVIEIPLGSGLSAPAPDPQAMVDGTAESRTYAVQAASYRTGDSLYVYGEEVPAGESRTYVVSLDVSRAGSRTIEADVRPLYNEPNNVRATATATATAVGTLNVSVTDASRATLSGATVTVDGTDRTGGDLSLTLTEGSHTVSASASEVTLPAVNLTVPPNAGTNVSFTAVSVPTAPTVLATTGNGSVLAGSVLRGTTKVGDASQATVFEVSFTVDSEPGTTVVGVGPPPEVPDSFDSVTATVDGSNAAVTTAADGTMLVELTGAGPHDVTLTLTGYATGDASGDGVVDGTDARNIADAIASGSDGSLTGYADVNGDGAVTAVDAMLIAQREAGNRDDDYRRSG
ncbi:dockerin type I domain-containing protein [Natronomonas sp. EA1]|uniref:dockerin type I repeat-containing protein n=1 Tax=Natronomonas sp. EA1 TaxID=3421655 RepID=UPI003EBD492F